MSIPRFAANRDRNEPEIVQALRLRRALVRQFSVKGFPDLGVFHKGRLLLAEVKVPGEPFTPDQVDGFKEILATGVPVYVLETVEDAEALLKGTLPVWDPATAMVWSRSGGRQKRAHRPGKSKARFVAELCTEDGCATSSLNGDKGPCAKHAPPGEAPTPAPRRTRETVHPG